MKQMNLMSPSKDGSVYEIRNKDRVLGTFEWLDDDTVMLVQDYGLPRFIARSVNGWVESRTPPKHRAHMDTLLTQLGLGTLRSVVDFSKGLSLTDTLWVASSRETLCWDEVSLFKNPFDEVIARIAFDGGLYGIPLSTTTPELGTNGMLAKCWVRRSNGSIVLLKTGTEGASNAGNEPYSENLAHQVLTRLEYVHVPYAVARYHGRLVSVCPIFTSEQEMFLPIYRYFDFHDMYELLTLCSESGIVQGLAEHLVFDYLSWNTDRHAGNLGVVLDADTFELKRFAGIFDNGVSMLNYWNGTDDLDEYITHSTPALYDSFERGAKLGKRVLGKKHNVQNLIGFKFDRTQVPGYASKRVDTIEQWLQGRVQKFLSM